jgi:hypothetical protein
MSAIERFFDAAQATTARAQEARKRMTCDLCRDIVDREDVPHVIRACPGCGREMHVVELGEHGRGIKIETGDRFVIPANWLQLSLNPLKSTGSFTRPGLQWFAEQIFVNDLPIREADFQTEMKAIEERADQILQDSVLISDLAINNPDHSERIFDTVKEKQGSVEWWAFWMGLFVSVARDAAASGQTSRALWATACAERCRAMLVFKEHLEEVVWMGHSAKRIVDIMKIWDNQKENADEEFWQITFKENVYVLSQVFAVPMVFIQDKAYVGGMKLDRGEAKFVDYLFSAESSREAILIEIKTPATRILGSEYRNGVFPPSPELSGAVVQVLRYRAELARNLQAITEDREIKIATFSPKCVIVTGNAEAQFKDPNMRKSFELYRGVLKDVEIVTYDELFRKVEVLANLFNLVRSKR